MFGSLLVVAGLVVGLAFSMFLFQWDSAQRAATVTLTPATAAPATAASGAQGPRAANAAEKPGEGAIQSGKAVYNKSCNSCHPNGKAGVGPPVIGLSEESIKAAVRQGKGSMPAFGEAQISDSQLAELLAYVRSLK